MADKIFREQFAKSRQTPPEFARIRANSAIVRRTPAESARIRPSPREFARVRGEHLSAEYIAKKTCNFSFFDKIVKYTSHGPNTHIRNVVYHALFELRS